MPMRSHSSGPACPTAHPAHHAATRSKMASLESSVSCLESRSPLGIRRGDSLSTATPTLSGPAHAPRPNSAPYTASKHAITGLTRSTALDGRKYDIACGKIDIGNALTDMTRSSAVGQLQPDGAVRPEPRMDVEHVAQAIVFMASLPLESNVQSMTIMATKMPFIGRG